MAEELNLILKVSREEAVKGLDDTAKKILQVKSTQEQLNDAKKANAITQQEYVKQMAVEKEKISLLSQEQKKYVKTINSQDGSMVHLAQTLASTKRKYQELSQAERENVEIGGKMKAQIDELDKEHKDLQKSIGNNSVEVGNYRAEVKNAIDDSGLLGGVLGGKLTQGMDAATKATNLAKASTISLKAAMLTLPLLLIVAGLTAVWQWFNRTEEGEDKLRIITTALTTVFQTFMDVVSLAGKAIFEAFSNPKKAVEDFGKVIQDFVLGRIELMMKGIKGFATAFKLAMAGDFSDAMDEAGEALLNFSRGTNPLVMAGEALLNTGKEVANTFDTALDKSKQAIALEERANQLLKDKREFLKYEEDRLTKIADLKNIAADQNADAVAREAALSESLKLQNELAADKARLATEAHDIKKAQNALNDSSAEDLDEEAQLYREIGAVQRSNATAQKEIISQMSGLQKQQAAAELKAAEEKKARLEEEAQFIEDMLAKELEDIEAQNLAKLELQIAREEQKLEQEAIFREEATALEEEIYEMGLESEEERAQYKLDREYEREYARIEMLKLGKEEEIALLTLLDKKYHDAKAKLSEDAAKKEIKWSELTSEAKGELARDAFNDVSTILGEESKAGKAAAVASTTIDAIVGAQRSYNALAPIVPAGPALGALAAASLAAGFARVKKIVGVGEVKRKKMAMGGWIGGRTHAEGGTNINAEAGEFIINKRSMANPQMAAAAIQINNAGNSNNQSSPLLTEERVAEIATQATIAANAATPVYVVESDINEKQRKAQVRESKFSA